MTGMILFNKKQRTYLFTTHPFDIGNIWQVVSEYCTDVEYKFFLCIVKNDGCRPTYYKSLKNIRDSKNIIKNMIDMKLIIESIG